MMRRHLRCAVYTRKSTDEGLDQVFNSLQAQREACAAYIRSQTGEGWTIVKTGYDDGGISGGTMNRPALQRLLADVESHRIDIVVVYKVDRLTRSLSDFARIIEIFDAHGVSFVSVTQQFNTTSSMGRLTLNVLLSFAQFEREVTAERIRDKIAASKRKGMWMGGVVPLGYDVVDRKLIINEAGASTIRLIYELYLKTGSVPAVSRELERRGIQTRPRRPDVKRSKYGGRFFRGHLSRILSNPLYIGEVEHKGARYSGEHAPIIDRAVWDAVQAKLAVNAVGRRSGANARCPSLLAGLLYDETGARLSPTHTRKGPRRYRYYLTSPSDAGSGWRLPAAAIEGIVAEQFRNLLRDERRTIDVAQLADLTLNQIKAALRRAGELEDQLPRMAPAEHRDLLLTVIDRIVIQEGQLSIHVDRRKLRIYLTGNKAPVAGIKLTNHESDHSIEPYTLDVPLEIRRRGVEMKLVVAGGSAPPAAPDQKLLSLIANAHRWFSELQSGDAKSVHQLAERHGVHWADVSRTLPLAFLAPDIVEAILMGCQPVDLTATRLRRRRNLPTFWAHQRQLLGFR